MSVGSICQGWSTRMEKARRGGSIDARAVASLAPNTYNAFWSLNGKWHTKRSGGECAVEPGSVCTSCELAPAPWTGLSLHSPPRSASLSLQSCPNVVFFHILVFAFQFTTTLCCATFEAIRTRTTRATIPNLFYAHPTPSSLPPSLTRAPPSRAVI